MSKWIYDKREIAENIRRYRKLKGYRQEDLGMLVFSDRHKISRIENGKYEPKLYELIMIANALGVSPYDFQGIHLE